MSLQEVLDSIRASGDAQLQEVEADANRQVREILMEAEAQVREINEKARETASTTAGAERARILHLAKLEALHNLGSEREALIESTLDHTRGWLENFRVDEKYKVVLRHIVEEALADIDDSTDHIDQVNIEADPRDQALLSAILSDLGVSVKVAYQLETWGGVIARTQDARIIVINTLESRLERAVPYLRRNLSAYYENGLELPDRMETEVNTQLSY